ncbi:transposase [Candidatus Albibeggiatoa sp. nov. BB20]|uniref:transposase n=1 Tax=Candidatus Albibeggiatoa sp. nov. BB20 TaxID=3162723 RepID=UPI003365334D
MEQFIALFRNERIDYVTGDREFIGEEGLSWLIEHNIEAVLRIKKDTIIETVTGIKSIKHILENEPVGKVLYLEQVTVWGQTVCVEAKKLTEERFIIVLAANKNDIIKAYKLRWNIETLFGNLKSRGFNLEATRISKPQNIHKLPFINYFVFSLLLFVMLLTLKLGRFLRKILFLLRNLFFALA